MASTIIKRSKAQLQEYNYRLESRRLSLRTDKIRKPNVLSVIFITWNRDTYLSKTIDSFLKYIKNIEPNIVIEMISIDNGSTNKNVLKILDKYKWDISIRNEVNLGITVAINQGVGASSGEFVICLEDDWETIAKAPFIQPSIDIIRNYSDIGGVRLKESIHLFIKDRTVLNKKQTMLTFDRELLRKDGLSWRGKFVQRGWFDLRGEANQFYTWSNDLEHHKFANTYANSCFLFAGKTFDVVGKMEHKLDKEFAYSLEYGRYYNAAVMLGERRFIHLGVESGRRELDGWHE